MGARAVGYGDCRPGKFFDALTGELLAFADAKIALSERLPDGATLEEHYASVARQTGVTPPELARAPECPEEFAYLWDHFRSISQRRTFMENGMPEVITHSEIAAWCTLHGHAFTPAELDVLDALERLYVASESKRVANLYKLMNK